MYDHGQAAGLTTDTLPAAHALHLPLLAHAGVVGVLAVAPENEDELRAPETRHLLEALANQLTLAIERPDAPS